MTKVQIKVSRVFTGRAGEGSQVAWGIYWVLIGRVGVLLGALAGCAGALLSVQLVAWGFAHCSQVARGNCLVFIRYGGREGWSQCVHRSRGGCARCSQVARGTVRGPGAISRIL